MLNDRPIRLYYLVAFVAGFCTMAIELAAGRIMAPHVGVSLYSWTSIIGVVLAGIALGSYAGGRIVDRIPGRGTLGALLVLSGFSCLAILGMLGGLDGGLAKLPVPFMARVTILVASVFLLPSFLMGAATPAVARLTLNDLSAAGTTIGRIYAFSTVGSIVGTFATGFVLVSWLGTRMLVAAVALLLVAAGLIAGDLWRRRRAAAVATVLLLLAFGHLLNGRDAFTSPYWKESNYYSIRLLDPSEGAGGAGQVRVLILDHLMHSINSLTDPTYLAYPYQRVYADLVEYMSQTRPSMDVLFVGGGGYTFPRYMEQVYPTGNLEVIEIDPEVTRCAYEELGLRRDSRIVTHNMDGRMFFDGSEGLAGRYDLIVGDAFNDLSIPYHLTTLEFDEKVRRALKPDGVFLANVIDNPARGSFLRPYLNTLSRVFPHVTIAGMGHRWLTDSQTTLIVVGSNEPLDPAHFAATLAALRGGIVPTTRIMERADFAEYVGRGKGTVLTDDHAPVDQLISVLLDE